MRANQASNSTCDKQHVNDERTARFAELGSGIEQLAKLQVVNERANLKNEIKNYDGGYCDGRKERLPAVIKQVVILWRYRTLIDLLREYRKHY